jgi:hypothetical protein
LSVQLVLCLTVERWVFNQAIDHNEEMIDNLSLLQLVAALLLLFEDLRQVRSDLVGDVRNVLSTARGVNCVHKGNLLMNRVVADPHADFPPFRAGESDGGWNILKSVEVILERLDWQLIPIQRHSQALSPCVCHGASDVVRSFGKQANGGCIEIFHFESL